MPLLDERDIRMQIKLHKLAHKQTFGPNVPYSTGIFPTETAFSTRIIPVLVAEGLEWAIVDNIHFDSAINNAGDAVPGVTASDFQVWKSQFQASLAQAASTSNASVPAPATWMLFAAACYHCRQ